ncbi:MAG TPA: NAD-dependent epimerase/dehydratase family protein [Solirubrobacteraceae bacterium]|jgi:CDP-paratose 2-epimerase|nr:NAD-dependent epimerase/dehydratase family protein [Solirubrobacteraceae bacterium]
MSARTVLITGGAGFIGASLALELAARHPSWEVVAFDNLHRRGSELNLPRLRDGSVRFVHGDVREFDDLRAVGPFDALVECSAEPSVMAGVDGATGFLIHTNLLGAYHCLEVAARYHAQVVLLSTSRVYPVAPLCALAYRETDTRFELGSEQALAGASPRGIAEDFPLGGARTLYGASKLSAELLVTEYAETFGLQTVVNRCGVVAGPWQMGKVDQGVFTYWMLAHHFKRQLAYLGFGGTGKQVRDLLHVADLAELIDDQLVQPEHWAGAVVNVGGGAKVSLSLRETSALCEQITGNNMQVGGNPETRQGDVPIYISDCGELARLSDWAPKRDARQILEDIHLWLCENEREVAATLA